MPADATPITEHQFPDANRKEMIRARELLTDSGSIFVQMWKIAARCIRVLRVINLELTVKSDHLNT